MCDFFLDWFQSPAVGSACADKAVQCSRSGRSRSKTAAERHWPKRPLGARKPIAFGGLFAKLHAARQSPLRRAVR